MSTDSVVYATLGTFLLRHLASWSPHNAMVQPKSPWYELQPTAGQQGYMSRQKSSKLSVILTRYVVNPVLSTLIMMDGIWTGQYHRKYTRNDSLSPLETANCVFPTLQENNLPEILLRSNSGIDLVWGAGRSGHVARLARLETSHNMRCHWASEWPTSNST